MNNRKYRPECEDCLHRYTHICTGCLSNRLKMKHEMGQDRWEPEEAKRDDGLIVYDACGHINSIMATQCGVCQWWLPKEWIDLPNKPVPPIGEWE